jgi:hypothetical protein
VGLCNSGGSVVASSTNRSADSALTTSNSTWAAPLSSIYAAPAGTYYALAMVYMGTGGTTPGLGATNGSFGRAGNAGQSAGAYPASALTGQTSIGTAYTLSSNATTGNWYWVGLS